MIRSLCGQLKKLSVASPLMRPSWPAMAARASSSVQRELLDVTPPSLPEEEDPRYAPGSFLHHGTRLRYRNRPKFDSPRKKASKMYTMIMNEHIEKSKEYTPDVWKDDFRVGDAVELDIVEQGGIDTTDKSNIEKQRGVILGIRRKNMEFSVHIRDVIDGHAVEQLIPLHSPLVKKLTVLEKNFVHRGRKRVKRAKLYHMADWKPSCKSHDELSKSPPTIRCFSNLLFSTFFYRHAGHWVQTYSQTERGDQTAEEKEEEKEKVQELKSLLSLEVHVVLPLEWWSASCSHYSESGRVKRLILFNNKAMMLPYKRKQTIPNIPLST